MAKQKINISIYDDISLLDAISAVAAVIRQGRISDDGNCFCYATVFGTSRIVVEASANRLDSGSNYASSDSFRVLRDKA